MDVRMQAGRPTNPEAASRTASPACECVDVASARILEECGHPAIATTSAGIAYSLGYPDGQRISRARCSRSWAASRARAHSGDRRFEVGYGTTPKRWRKR